MASKISVGSGNTKKTVLIRDKFDLKYQKILEFLAENNLLSKYQEEIDMRYVRVMQPISNSQSQYNFDLLKRSIAAQFNTSHTRGIEQNNTAFAVVVRVFVTKVPKSATGELDWGGAIRYYGTVGSDVFGYQSGAEATQMNAFLRDAELEYKKDSSTQFDQFPIRMLMLEGVTSNNVTATQGYVPQRTQILSGQESQELILKGGPTSKSAMEGDTDNFQNWIGFEIVSPTILQFNKAITNADLA